MKPLYAIQNTLAGIIAGAAQSPLLPQLRRLDQQIAEALAKSAKAVEHNPDEVPNPKEGYRFLTRAEIAHPPDGDIWEAVTFGWARVDKNHLKLARTYQVLVKPSEVAPSVAPKWHNPDQVLLPGPTWRYLTPSEAQQPKKHKSLKVWCMHGGKRHWGTCAGTGHFYFEFTYATEDPLPGA